VPPDHPPHHLRQAGLRNGAVGHHFAVTHDGKVVADLENLGQVMRDEDDPYSVIRQPADQAKRDPHLRFRQR
jgi:hypothetical protein